MSIVQNSVISGYAKGPIADLSSTLPTTSTTVNGLSESRRQEISERVAATYRFGGYGKIEVALSRDDESSSNSNSYKPNARRRDGDKNIEEDKNLSLLRANEEFPVVYNRANGDYNEAEDFQAQASIGLQPEDLDVIGWED